ncbi:MAG: phosphoglucomutase/phosphomannomutase family protein [Anaerolineales bacterium]|nr:phosphoglucomutase/phosphomannomutase family protein [Anaerolineales bacterium]
MLEELVIKFGTDGWRGVIAEDYTFANVRRCAQGFAAYLLAKGWAGQSVVVGHDKRFGSEHFAAAVAEVLAGNGLKVWLTDGPTPTPVIAFAVVERRAKGAINITASHNPPTDNGFKVRDPHGGAIDPEGLQQIEAAIPGSEGVQRLPYAAAAAQKLIEKFDAAPAYIENLRKLVDLEAIKAAGLRVLVDAMWGNGGGWFPRLLAGGATTVQEIHAERNPSFPEMRRPEPIPPNVDVGLRATVARGADVLLITDGDADRMGIGDEHGRFLNQLQVMALLAFYLLEIRGQRGPIVKTLSTTSMLNKLGQLYDVPVYETGVGFKYVAPKMMETDAILGGEESGGYAFKGNVPERDGILGNLLFLDFLVRTGKKPSQLLDLLFSKVGAHYYDRVDVQFPTAQRADVRRRVQTAQPGLALGGLRVATIDTTDGFKFNFEGGGWMLIRFSGTEPIIRVYCEVLQPEQVQPVLQAGLSLAGLRAA